MIRRDPRDRRYGERIAGSYLASLLLHLLLAALLFSVAASSSQEGASESVNGGSLVTLEQRVPPVAVAAVPAPEVQPVPNAARIAPIRHAMPASSKTHPQPPQKQELSKFNPSAPPNPSPLPQASPQPHVQPTTAVYEATPQNALPAVPTSVPSAPVVAVNVKIPPTAAPTAVPTRVPTARPSPVPPQPTAPPTVTPRSPAPAATVSPQPTASPVPVARATAAPSAGVAPPVRPSLAPSNAPGVPSPSPTQGAAIARAAGSNPSPAPKGQGSPGPRAGNAGKAITGSVRPVSVPQTPSPAPTAASAKGSGGTSGVDINAKLRALLPSGPVTPVAKSYHAPVGLGSLQPTPPPDVVAVTKFIYQASGGSDADVKMWVTGTHREGPLLICDGWMLRFPHASQPAAAVGTVSNPISGGVQVNVGGIPGGRLAPIVEEHASVSCRERDLTPFAAPTP